MTKKLLIYPLFIGFLSLKGYSQYCTNVGPSSSIDSNVEFLAINGESSTAINYTGCPGITGLEDLTASSSIFLAAGNSYTLDVLFGTCGNNFNGVGEAWIDFNGNQTFETTESIGTWSGTPPTTLSSFNFTVPTNCVNASVRMRVIHWEGGTLPLNPCGTFSWGSATDFEVVLSGGSGGSGYCTSVGPSSNLDSNLELFQLTGESGTYIDFTGCPGVTGLNDQTANHSVTLGQGMSYTADLVFGTCGGSYNGVGEAWIDYNQSGTFEPSESIGTWSGSPPSSTTFSFTVPISTTMGSTRMRVIQHENGTLPIDPCGTFTWGSVTDFEVVIGQGIDCSGYVGDSMQDPRIVTTLPYSEDYSNQVCYSNNVTVYNSPDVFYRLVPADYNVTDINVSLCGSQFDSYLQILDTAGNVIKSNDDYCGFSSELTFSAIGYDTVFVVVQGYDNEKGDYSISINDAATVSTKQNGIDTDINMYPNPTQTGSVNIVLSENVNEIEIYSTNGEKILHKDNLSSQSILLDDLARGVYLVRFYKGSQSQLKKLIVL